MQPPEALGIAGKIFDYYYSHAVKDFNSDTAASLAQIPADYVYNSLVNNKECYINGECCLEYCYDHQKMYILRFLKNRFEYFQGHLHDDLTYLDNHVSYQMD